MTVLNRFARLIVFFAAVQILGGHWLALQSVAWFGMLANYARGGTLAVAIEKTFDGAHPCGLCQVVKNGREEEQKQQSTKTIVHLDAVLAVFATLTLPPVSDWNYLVSAQRIDARSFAPPKPPPQTA